MTAVKMETCEPSFLLTVRRNEASARQTRNPRTPLTAGEGDTKEGNRGGEEGCIWGRGRNIRHYL